MARVCAAASSRAGSIAESQRTEQNGVHDGEDFGVRANAER
jgi:hypothetical protein